MANRYAVASGNWSNTATWNGGTLPTSADDVYANNFAVTVDQNIDVISLRNTAAGGITQGGSFNFNTSGVTADISNTIFTALINFVSPIYITASTGTVTLNVPNTQITSLNITNAVITYSGNCNFIINCLKLTGSTTGNTNTFTLNKTSTGNLTINGIVEGNNANVGGSGATVNIGAVGDVVINGDLLGGSGPGIASRAVNITAGNLAVTGNVTGGIGIGGYGIISSTNGTINITGNLAGGAAAAIQSTAGTLNVTGTINGGTSNGIVGALIGGGTFNHIGIVQASAFGSAISCNTPTTSTITCTGPFLRNGFIPAIVSQTLRINALSNPYFEFRKSDNTNVTYVDEDTLNFPTELDVREGTTYASGLYTGTLAVPLPSNVRVGIATDDTVGTADLTAEDMWNYLTSNTFASGSMGDRMKNVSTVASTGAQIASYSV